MSDDTPQKQSLDSGRKPQAAKKRRVGRGLGEVPEEPYCPVCLELGFKEELFEVTGLVVVAPNPQAEKGAPRVIDCTGGCRFSLEPYFNPMSDGRFCYMVLDSKRNPGAVVNHYWFKAEWIGPPRTE